MRWGRVLILVVLSLSVSTALAATGCGGDDDETTTTEAAQTTDTVEATGEDEAQPEDEPDPADGSDEGRGDGEVGEGEAPTQTPEDRAISEERIALIRELVEEIRSDRDPEEIRDRVQEIRDRLAELRGKAGQEPLTPEQRAERRRRAREFGQQLEQQAQEGGDYFDSDDGD